MILFWVLVIVVLLAAWLLCAPLVIRADTREIIDLRWKTIGGARIFAEGDQLVLRGNIFFIGFRWRLEDLLLKERRRKKKKQGVRATKKKSRRKGGPNRLPAMWRVLRSFRLRRLYIEMDTGNFTLNARLYPLNHYPFPVDKRLHINFLGENYVILHLVNAPWRILYAWVRK